MIRYNPKAKQRSLDTLRWGLIPYWTTDPKIAYKTINARAETVDTVPSYREAFKKRWCLIPADGFYEWRTIGGTKIPFAIGMKDDRPFVFASLREGWKDSANDEWLRTCKWLGEIEDGDLKELLKPYPAEEMKMWPISQRVNSRKNDDPSLVEPIRL